MITTKQLRYFDAVARLGHFGQAAEACAISQPALSMQIAELERQLDVVLIERRPKGVRLTGPGREIARRAERLLLDLRDIFDYAATCKAPLTAPIRLGLIPTVAPYVLPTLLLSLRERHSGLELRIREAQTRSLLAELLAGSLDLLVLALPIPHPEIQTSVLRDDRFLLAVPSWRTFGSRVRISPELIQNDKLLLLEEGHCLRDQALAVCHLQPTASSDMLGASSLSTVVQMVTYGLGLTLLPEISIARETANADVKLIRFVNPEPKRTLGLAWRKTSPRASDFVELGELINEALASLISSK
jgi:LysR family transcriptional regulator, hydrogen peroxide-inducible genes activator